MEKLALEICTAIKDAGGVPYFVGGWVRDRIIGRPSKDIDLEVFNLPAEQLEPILAKFGEVNFVGKAYGCYKVQGIDITLPRKDKQVGLEHTEVEAEIDIHMSIEEAAQRRDLTMNAIYMDLFTEQYFDPCEGITALCLCKEIVHVSEKTFGEDPLRPVRAARFRATLPQLSLHDFTRNVCMAVGLAKVKSLPSERVFGELTKVLLEAPIPSIFFHALEAMNLLEVLFPELYTMKSIEQGKEHHPEGNVYNHTLLTLDVLPVRDRALDVMLALLFHDLGKALVPVEVEENGERIHFKGHAEDLTLAKKALARLTNDVALTESVLSLIEHHMRPYDFRQGAMTKKRVRRLATTVDIPKLVDVHLADKLGRGFVSSEVEDSTYKLIREMLDVYEEIRNEIKPMVQGRDLIELGQKPGPHFGKWLKELYEAQLDEKFSNKEEGVKYFLRESYKW